MNDFELTVPACKSKVIVMGNLQQNYFRLSVVKSGFKIFLQF